MTSSSITSNEPVRFIVDEPGYDTETGIKGRGYSPNNGKTFLVQNTTKGRIFRQLDGDRIWPFLKDKVRSIMSLSWDEIKDKPVVVTMEQLEQRLAKLNIPATMSWNQITDKPTIPSIGGLATTSALGEVKSTAESAKNIAKQAQSTAETASSKAEQSITLANDAKPKIDSTSQTTNKKPSEYSEGIFHEVKDVSALGIDRSQIAPELQKGHCALVTTKKYNGYVRQVAEVVDSSTPATFVRNGENSTWYSWLISQLTAY